MRPLGAHLGYHGSVTVTPADLAATLRRRHREEIAREAAERDDVRRRLDESVSRLDLPPESRLWLIGSLPTDKWGVRSDVDLVVEGVDREQERLLWGRLSADLPVPVDLLRLEELPEGFRRRVLEEGVLLRER